MDLDFQQMFENTPDGSIDPLAKYELLDIAIEEMIKLDSTEQIVVLAKLIGLNYQEISVLLGQPFNRRRKGGRDVNLDKKMLR